MDETKTCEGHKPRRRTTSVLLEVKETKRCSTLVKTLILAVALLIICCLILLNLYLIERSRPKVGIADKRVKSPSQSPALEKYYGGSCWTTDCLHAASDLMKSVDPSVDPCKDFYLYACGGWMKKYPRPPSSNRWDQFEKLTTENNEVIEMLLRDKELKAIYSKEEAVWKALAYYDSCMDVDEIERLKGKPLKKLIKEYGSWNITDENWEEKDWDFVSNLARIHKDLVSPILFSMAVVIDNKNSSQNAITFGESYTSLSRREHLTNDSESLRVREAYKGLMKNLTRKLGAPEASEAQLLEIFQFEKELAKISTPRFKMPTFEQAYKKLTLSELQNYTGNFVNWTKYVAVMMEDNSFQVDSQTKVVVYSLEYLRRLVKLLSKTPKRAMNYGAIGGVMAHEITHGFDDTGKLYDSEGNRRKWWSNSTLKNFKERSRCLVEQYSNYTFYGYQVNGEKTLSENIADNGGVRVALEAYRTWVRGHWEESRLPGLMLTNEQVFFISFARNWCSHYSDRAARVATKYYDHSPMPWRVNGTLMNFPEFAEAFSCPLGSPMNPKHKCRVW